ncbi:MAG: DnaD domain-containing protein [Bacillota bacterium]
MFTKTGNTVKKYRQGNIASAFGTDLWMSGAVNVPSLLLKYYRHMGITDSEMMTLIQLFRFCTQEKILKPAAEDLTECLSSSPEEIESNIKALFAKKVIAETLYYDIARDDVITGYDFEPLVEKLSDYWACARAKEIEKAGAKLEGHGKTSVREDIAAECFKSFEKEFGRPLSPIETEKIAQWIGQAGPELVQEALRRAVLNGKWNFRYIDTILLEWKKNNLTTVGSVTEHDRQYQSRKSSRETRKKESMRPEDMNADNKRRALFKKLYLT